MKLASRLLCFPDRSSPASSCAWLAALLMTLSLAACGGKPGEDASAPAATSSPAEAPLAAPAEAVATGAFGGSCNTPTVGLCSDYTGPDHVVADIKNACTSEIQAYSAEACPTADRVGTCLNNPGMGTELKLHYYAAFPGGGDAAKVQCTDMLKGEWTAE